jgi:hypothetical protein
MQPIVEFEELLKQDAHEDGISEAFAEQQSTDRRRTYSDSSMTSIDGEDSVISHRTKSHDNKDRLQVSWSLDNQPQPFFSNAIELYGAQLVNPLLLLTSSMETE